MPNTLAVVLAAAAFAATVSAQEPLREVRTPDELIAALDDGVAHIHIVDHILLDDEPEFHDYYTDDHSEAFSAGGSSSTLRASSALQSVTVRGQNACKSGQLMHKLHR